MVLVVALHAKPQRIKAEITVLRGAMLLSPHAPVDTHTSPKHVEHDLDFRLRAGLLPWDEVMLRNLLENSNSKRQRDK